MASSATGLIVGLDEHEVLEGNDLEDVESDRKWKKCTKNPGHLYFKPLGEVILDTLPEKIKDEEILKFILAAANLTVKIRVDKTSLARPQDMKQYYGAVGDRRYGTGFVYGIEPTEGPCACDYCRDKKDKISWIIKVRTALHVVFDEEEARSTAVNLFYDEEKSAVKSVQGVGIRHKDTNIDLCRFNCITHEADLVAKLRGNLNEWEIMRKSLRKRIWPDESNTAVIISHPHAKPKYLTVGEVTDWCHLSSGDMQLVYNVPTCAGSSGATVWWLGRDKGGLGSPMYGVHHCKTDDQKEANIGYF